MATALIRLKSLGHSGKISLAGTNLSAVLKRWKIQAMMSV
jgi:hypothetical protein